MSSRLGVHPSGGDPRLARLAPLLRGLVRRLAGGEEDAYQDLWVHLLARLDRFDPHGPASFTTWAWTVASRHLVDRWRRRGVWGFDPAAPDELPAPSTPHPGLRVDLEAAVAALPEAWRVVVVLHHVYDTPLDEIAAVTGLPVGTVKSRLHRARAALLAHWEGP